MPKANFHGLIDDRAKVFIGVCCAKPFAFRLQYWSIKPM